MARIDITDEERDAWIRGWFAREDAALAAIGAEAAAAGLPDIAISAEVGRLLEIIARAIGAKRALELGTLAGYSGIWIARGLREGGTLVTIEADPKHAQIARRNFAAAGLADRVTVKVGRALEVLATFPSGERFDLVSIDAQKSEYPAYLDEVLRLVRPGGAIVADNALLGGRAVRSDGSAEAEAMRTFVRRIAEHPRLTSTVIPIRDGVSISIVR